MTDEQHLPEGNQAILTVYGLLCVGIVFSMVPVLPIFFTGMMLIPFVLVLAWMLRFGKSPDTLIYNHMIYISRTIWMFSLLLTITSSIAGFLVMTGADNSAYQNILNDMMNGISYSHDQMYDVMISYIKTNMGLMICAVALCTIPTLGYVVYRLTRGMSRALKGYRLANPQAWF